MTVRSQNRNPDQNWRLNLKSGLLFAETYIANIIMLIELIKCSRDMAHIKVSLFILELTLMVNILPNSLRQLQNKMTHTDLFCVFALGESILWDFIEKGQSEDPSADLQLWAPALIKACSDTVHAPWIPVYESSSEFAARKKRLLSQSVVSFICYCIIISGLCLTHSVFLSALHPLFLSLFCSFFGGGAGNETLLLTWKVAALRK